MNNTVTWVNNDYTIHTVTSDSNSFDSGLIQPEANFSMTFTTAETYQYHCSIHVWMKATVTVIRLP